MPSEQRKLTGAPKLRKRKPARRASQGDAPVAPASLSIRAIEIWNELLPLYEAKGLLVQLDSDMLAVYCQVRADREEALELLENEGRYYTTPSGLVRLHPANGIASRSAVMMARLANELALLPRGRAVLVPERKPVASKCDDDNGSDGMLD